jgi:hypothetical protein
MYTIFWPKTRWISRSNAISALEGVVRIRGNRVRGAIGIIGRLVTMRGLVKRMQIYLVY